jgi:hypothetical protein
VTRLYVGRAPEGDPRLGPQLGEGAGTGPPRKRIGNADVSSGSLPPRYLVGFLLGGKLTAPRSSSRMRVV